MKLVVAALFLSCAALVGGAEPASELPPLVYVPVEGERPDLDPGQQRVQLAYERWLAVLTELETLRARKPEQAPALAAALGPMRISGAVRGDAARFTVNGSAVVMAEGWTTLDLDADWHLSDFSADHAAVALFDLADTPALQLPGRGRYPFTAELAVPVLTDAGGVRSFGLDLPNQAPVQLSFDLPVANAAVTLEPAMPMSAETIDGVTRLSIAAGGCEHLEVRWQPPLPPVASDALLLAELHQKLTVAERSLRWEVAGAVEVLRRPVTTLRFRIPDGAQVLRARSEALRAWSVEGEQLVLVFDSPQEAMVSVGLVMERPQDGLAAGDQRRLAVTWPLLVGAGRSTGSVALVAGDGMALAVEDSGGLVQVDPTTIPYGQDGGASAGYRSSAEPDAMQLVATRLAPELRADVHQLVRLGREEDRIACRIDLDLRKSGVFALTFTAPANWELVDTAGLAIDDLRNEELGDGRRRYQLDLRNRLLGRATLELAFSAPGTLVDAGQAVHDHAIQVVALPDARRITGSLVVASPRSWSLASDQRSALASARVGSLERESGVAPLLHELAADEEAALGFTITGAGAGLVLSAVPRAREIHIAQEARYSIAATQIEARIHWRGEIRYSAADVVVIEADPGLDDLLRLSADNLAEVRRGELVAGRRRWELRFTGPQRGPIAIQAGFVQPVPAAPAAGASSQMTLPALQLLDAAKRQVAVAVVGEGSLEIRVDDAGLVGLQSVVAGDLPPGLQGPGVVAALRGSAPNAVPVTVTRHDLVPLADAGIAVAGFTVVVSADGSRRVRGVLPITSRGRSWLGLQLPAGAELLEVTVDGRTGRPSRRDDGTLVVPLGESTGRRVVALVYESAGTGPLGSAGSVSIALPTVAGDGERPLPVERSVVDCWLPADLRVRGVGGDFQAGLAGPALAGLVPGPGRGSSSGSVPGGDFGLTVPVEPVGRLHRMTRGGQGGVAVVAYIAHGWLLTVALVAAAAAVAAVWLLRRHGRALGAMSLLTGVLLLGLPPPWLMVAVGWAVAWFPALVVAGMVALWCRWRRWRRARLLIDQPPWETTPPSTSAAEEVTP